MDQREQFVYLALKREQPIAELCRSFGISRKTGYKWLARFDAGGSPALEDRPPTPGPHPHALGIDVIAHVLAVRRRFPFWGPKKIRAWMDEHVLAVDPPAASTIGRILEKHGLVRPRRRRRRVDPATQPFSACKAPNDVWCTDFKGHFRLGNGERCHPLTLTDACSRYVLRCEGLEGEGTEIVQPVYEAAFVEYGLPLAMLSDNGPPFATLGAGGLSRLAVWWVKLGIRPERIEPGKPQQNGRHERMHRTLKHETARPAQERMPEQQLVFDRFRLEFNEERPHEALGQRTPASVYVPSNRRYPCPLRSPEYPGGWEVRLVAHNGSVKWRGERFFVSECLAGENVGFEETADGLWRATYGPVHLGTVNEHGKNPIFIRPGPTRRVSPKLPV
jgi:transposase InsO family protein